MREVVLDTETTGLNPRDDRIIEIGCIELMNHLPTGEIFHTYVNPKREIAAEAFEVHGLSVEFLADKPVFADIAQDLARFLADAPLVIHNAAFDLSFLNAEFDRIGYGQLPPGRGLDTLMIARRRFPGGQNSLDGLCRRFNIDNSSRTRHGALLDAELLADVYLELVGGRQRDLMLDGPANLPGAGSAGSAGKSGSTVMGGAKRDPRPRALPSRLTPQERKAHEAFIATLSGDPLWNR